VWWSLRGLSDPIDKGEISYSLSDHLREERVEIDPGTRSLEPNLGKTNHRAHLHWSSLDLFALFPLSKSFLANIDLSLLPNVIRINWATHSKRNNLPHSNLILTLTPALVCVFKFINFRFHLFTPSRRISMHTSLGWQECALKGNGLACMETKNLI
jgi:hypothetical protein